PASPFVGRGQVSDAVVAITEDRRAPSPQAATVHAMIARYADALAAELGTSFAYVNHRYNDSQPATIFVIGGGSTSGAVCAALQSRLNIAIEPLSPMKLAECASTTTEKCSTALLTTALDLALYEE